MCGKLTYLIFLVFLLGLAGNTMADDLAVPDWAGAPGSTYAIWTFDADSGVAGTWFPEVYVGDEENHMSAGNLWTNEGPGSGNPDFAAVGNTPGGEAEWSDEFEGRQGVIGSFGELIGIINNYPRDEAKFKRIRIQMTYYTVEDPYALFVECETADEGDWNYWPSHRWYDWMEAEYGLENWPVTDLGGGWYHVFMEIDTHEGGSEGLMLNPGAEVFFTGGDGISTDIDQVIVDTICYEGAEPPSGPGRGGAVPGQATNPSPAGDDVCPNVVLRWTAGEYADKHDVYFGTAFDDVNDVNRTDHPGLLYYSENQDPNYYPLSGILELELGKPYYWRVDEVNAAPDDTIYKGEVWQFTTESFQIPNSLITPTADSTSTGGPDKTLDLLDGDLHPMDQGETMWLSSKAEGAWILYEFDQVYKLHEMWVWNHNTGWEDTLKFGVKNAAIKYSVDGENYDTLGGDGVTHEFGQAPGTADYAHDSNETFNNEIDFGGVAAQYVMIDVNSTFGGQRAGLSEVRFFYTPMRATEPISPADEEEGVARNVTLSWTPGKEITTHKVYISTDELAVIERTVDPCSVPADEGLCEQASHGPLSLDYSETYYWAVDEVNEFETPGTWDNNEMWSFTVTYDGNDIVDPNLLLWLKFDGDATDSSGYQRHGTENGVPAYVDGYDDRAIELDGDDDWVNISNPGNFNFETDFTWAAWIRTTSNGTILARAPATGDWARGGKTFFLRDGSIGVDVGWVGYFGSTGTVDDGQWHHVATTTVFETDGTNDTTTLYIDGSPAGSKSDWNVNAFSEAGLSVKIGFTSDDFPDQSWFTGLIDDVRIYDYALSELELIEIIWGNLAWAWGEVPKNGAQDVPIDTALSWRPGDFAPETQGHYVYFGTDPDNLTPQNEGLPQDSNSFSPGVLDLDTTYYWQVGEANSAAPGGKEDIPPKEKAWSFTTGSTHVIDDMESYTPWDIVDSNLFDVWRDGYGSVACVGGNGTGSLIYLEQGTIHGGEKAMIFVYDNDGKVYCASQQAEVDRDTYSKAKVDIDDLLLPVDPNWLAGGAEVLVLWFAGDVNDIEPMFVELTDSAGGKASVAYGYYADEDDFNDINDGEWHEWNIALQDFNKGATPVDLTDVNSIAIIIGEPANEPYGTGTMYFDDIMLSSRKCLLGRRTAGFAKADYVQDCVVDYKELDIMAENWLAAGVAPGDANLVAWYEFDGNANDSSVNNYHGSVIGNANTAHHDGDRGLVLKLDGDGDCVDLGNDPVFNPGADDFSISVWINMSSYGDNWANVIVGKCGEGGLSWQLRRLADTHRISFTTRGGGDEDGWGSGGQNISLDEWHHVAAVRDGTEKCLYIDGQREAVSDIEGYIVEDDHNVYIGARANWENTAPDGFFNGMIDDVRIYNKVLTDAEIVGLCGLRADLYKDKKIDFKDFAELAAYWLDEQYFPPAE